MEPNLPLLYFGPTGFYRDVLSVADATFVNNEKYSKQSLRSRCMIYGANGPIQLSIPVLRNSGQCTLVQDALLDYSSNWQQIHWRSIQSAYGKTPYFEYFADKIEPLYQDRLEKLEDFLVRANQVLFQILGKNFPSVQALEMSVELQKKLDAMADKKTIYPCEKYYQSFSDRHGFVPNLSVLDWIFHCGKKF